jgi:hypothetical protein
MTVIQLHTMQYKQDCNKYPMLKVYKKIYQNLYINILQIFTTDMTICEGKGMW